MPSKSVSAKWLKEAFIPPFNRFYFYIIIPVILSTSVGYDLFVVPHVSKYIQLSAVGLALTASSILGLVATLLYGRLIDSKGGLHGLLFASLFSACSLGLLAGLEFLAAFNLVVCLSIAMLVIIILSMVSGWSMMALRVLTSEIPHVEQKTRAWGWTLSILKITSTIGPLTAGFLASMGYKNVFIAAGLLHLIAFLYLLTLLIRRRCKPRRHAEIGRGSGGKKSLSLASELKELASLLRDRNVALYLIVVSIEAPYFSMRYMSLYLLKILGVKPEVLGTAFFVGGLASILAPIFGGFLSSKIGSKKAMMFGQCLLMGWMLSYFMASRPEHVFIIGLSGGLLPIYYPARDMYILEVLPSGLKGRVLALQNLFFALAVAPAPFLGSFVWSLAGPGWIFIFDMVLSLIAFMLIRYLRSTTS